MHLSLSNFCRDVEGGRGGLAVASSKWIRCRSAQEKVCLDRNIYPHEIQLGNVTFILNPGKSKIPALSNICVFSSDSCRLRVLCYAVGLVILPLSLRTLESVLIPNFPSLEHTSHFMVNLNRFLRVVKMSLGSQSYSSPLL